jgi:Tol biopolymer transport system component
MRTLFGMHSHLGALATAVRAALVAVALAVPMMLVIDSGPAEATFPGQNGKIAYESYNEIYTIDPDGSGKFKVTNNKTEDYEPSYSPDGKKIAYVGWKGADAEIYIINANGGGKTRLTDNSTQEYDPTFSPDGKRIAYHSESGGIYITNVGGGGKTKVTEGAHPTFSPDGKRIAYECPDRGWDGEICTIKVGGGGKLQLTNNKTDELQPDYSPDGKRIAYTHVDGRSGGQDAEIYTINVGGGGKLQLTDNEKDDEQPSYSPDGKRIAYTGWKAFHTSDDDLFDAEIYKMKAGGGGKVQVTNDNLTHDTVTATNPSWGSRP